MLVPHNFFVSTNGRGGMPHRKKAVPHGKKQYHTTFAIPEWPPSLAARLPDDATCSSWRLVIPTKTDATLREELKRTSTVLRPDLPPPEAAKHEARERRANDRLSVACC